MSGLRRVRFAVALAPFVAVLVSCQAARLPVTPGAQALVVGKVDPPVGAKNLGPIEAVNGHGCGLYGARGSYEGAEAELRNHGEKRGGDYVRIEKVTEPHVQGGCYDDRFTIRGVVFRVSPAGVPLPVADECSPPCSPGYSCESAICRAECDPPCAANQTCGQDRTCRSLAP